MRSFNLCLALSFLSIFVFESVGANSALAVDFSSNPLIAEPPANAEKIDVDKLPKLIVDSVKKTMPGARITKAMKFVDEGKTRYFLDDVKVGKKAWELTMTEDGKILKKEECHDE